MSHERRLFIEKFQIYTAMALCVILMYFFLWSGVMPSGIDRVTSYFATGDFSQLLIAVSYYWLFCVLAAFITALTRIQSALSAASAGLAAIAMRSEPLRLLFNRHEGQIEQLAKKMLPELLLWAVVIWIGSIIIRFIWLAIMERISDMSLTEKAGRLWLLTGLHIKAGENESAANLTKMLPQILVSAFIRALVASLVLSVVLNKAFDPERGQIVFSMFAAFFLASLTVAWSDSLADSDLSALLGVLILGVMVYAQLIVKGPSAAAPLEWASLKSWHMALPIDWMAAGCFGAFYGRWVALRMFSDLPDKLDEGQLEKMDGPKEIAQTVILKTFK